MLGRFSRVVTRPQRYTSHRLTCRRAQIKGHLLHKSVLCRYEHTEAAFPQPLFSDMINEASAHEEPFTVDDISEERTRRVPEEHYSVLVAPQSTQPGVTMSWQTNSKFNLATSSGDEASSYLEEIAHKQISFLSSPDPITHQYDLSFAALGNNRAPFSEAKKLYSALKAEGVQPSQHIIQRMFAMASSSINDFAWVAKEFENVQISDSIHIASAKIRFFTKVDSEPSRVISTFNAFRASTTCPPQAISCLYNVVIDSLRRMKYFDDAVALWNERRQRGLPIVNYSYEILNAIYIDTENIEKILSLYREMRAEGWIVSRWMTTIITTTLLNCGRLRDTKWVLEDTIRISGYGHTGSLLGAHLSYLSVTDDLQGYKDLLEQNRRQIDSHTIRVAIRGLSITKCRTELYARVLDSYCNDLPRALKTTRAIIIARLKLHLNQHEPQAAMELMHKIPPSERALLKEIDWSHYLGACLEAGSHSRLSRKPALANETLNDLLTIFTSPYSIPVLYKPFIVFYGRARDVRRLRKYWADLLARTPRPPGELFTTVIASLAFCGALDEATKAYKTMIIANVKPHASTFGVIALTYGMQNAPEKLQEIWLDWKDSGLSVTDRLLTSLIRAFTLVGQLSEALRIWHEFSEVYNHQYTSQNWLVIVNCCIKCNSPRTAVTMSLMAIESAIAGDIGLAIVFGKLITQTLVLQYIPRGPERTTILRRWVDQPHETDAMSFDQLLDLQGIVKRLQAQTEWARSE